ncbi:MAG: DMT family transporter [Anaerolineae bacterium]|nr:DMT family transporter [Anaerolineae bacterium]MDW8172025.1 DMT family transporter [Anaerolineae bacterium]
METLRGAVYGLSAASIWGGMYVVSDVVLDTIPPFSLLTLRLLLGALVLALLRLGQSGNPEGLKLPGARVVRYLGVGLVGFGFSLGAQFVGTALSTAINGALITSASPAFILLFAALLLRERLQPVHLTAISLATIGVLVIINPAQAELGGPNFLGDVALAIAALTWGLYSVLARLVGRSGDTLLVTLYALIGGLFVTIPASFIELAANPVDTNQIDLSVILGVLYLGIVSTAGAMWLWNRAFALVAASTASLFFFAQPLVGALLSVALLSQAMTSALWLGSALIVLGVLIALVSRRA